MWISDLAPSSYPVQLNNLILYWWIAIDNGNIVDNNECPHIVKTFFVQPRTTQLSTTIWPADNRVSPAAAQCPVAVAVTLKCYFSVCVSPAIWMEGK